MYCPDCVEGPADDKDVGEADVEVVERPEGAALGKPRTPYGQARAACDSSTDRKDETHEWIEAEDEKDQGSAEKLDVEVNGANLEEETCPD